MDLGDDLDGASQAAGSSQATLEPSPWDSSAEAAASDGKEVAKPPLPPRGVATWDPELQAARIKLGDGTEKITRTFTNLNKDGNNELMCSLDDDPEATVFE
eukprot:6646118-Alexandrium_andersonii.AAC.1